MYIYIYEIKVVYVTYTRILIPILLLQRICAMSTLTIIIHVRLILILKQHMQKHGFVSMYCIHTWNADQNICILSLFMFLATQSNYSYIWNWFTCCLCWKRRKDCQKLYAKAFFHYWTTKVSMNHLCCWSLNTIYMYVHSLITSSTTPLSHCKSYACLLTEVFINDKAKSSSDILAKEGYENLCYAAIPYTTKQRCSHMC